ncbi:hypothetical protein Pstr01_33130 [Pseudomonas straminea]|nr:hypothetical protein Pstr01_33130 [Pseudomonas straminea]
MGMPFHYTKFDLWEHYRGISINWPGVAVCAAFVRASLVVNGIGAWRGYEGFGALGREHI